MTTTEPKTCTQQLTEFIAQQLTGLHRINGAFVNTTGTISTTGDITMTVEQYPGDFAGDKRIAQILLHPIIITPTPEPTHTDNPTTNPPTTPEQPATITFIPATTGTPMTTP